MVSLLLENYPDFTPDVSLCDVSFFRLVFRVMLEPHTVGLQSTQVC